MQILAPDQTLLGPLIILGKGNVSLYSFQRAAERYVNVSSLFLPGFMKEQTCSFYFFVTFP